MVTFRSVRCPPGLGRCASRCPRCESAVAPGCACTRRSGPLGTAVEKSRGAAALALPDCRRGKAVASRANGLAMAGSTAWTARPALQQRALVSASVVVRMRATSKTSGSTSTGAAWSTGQPWPVAMARWGCGRRSPTSMSRPVGYRVGGRRPPGGETNGCRTFSRRPNNTSRRAGGCPTASVPCWRWTSSWRSMEPRILKRPPVAPKTARAGEHVTMARPRPGGVGGRPPRWHRRVRPYAYARPRPTEGSHASPCWRWCANCLRGPPSGGIGDVRHMPSRRACRGWAARRGSAWSSPLREPGLHHSWRGGKKSKEECGAWDIVVPLGGGSYLLLPLRTSLAPSGLIRASHIAGC
jgi:hypothetical protein